LRNKITLLYFVVSTNQKTGTVYNKCINIMTTIEKLTKFVNQRPGLDYSNYGELSSYRSEMAEITRDRTDYFELLSLAFSRIDNLNEVVTNYLKTSSGRLTMNEAGNLEYCTGQYFPTEYRPAANRLLRDIIWNSYSNELYADNTTVYTDGNDIRKAIKRRISRRIAKNYFN